MKRLNIINNPSENEPYLIVNKPSGLATAPISENDTNNLLSFAIEEFPQIKEITGKKKIEYGLIHRIDTVTEGLVLIALNQNSYDNLIFQQKDNRIKKTYSANCNISIEQKLPGFPEINLYFQKPFSQTSIESYFRFYGPGNKEVRPVVQDSHNKYAMSKIGKPKLYKTDIKVLSKQDDYVSVECSLTNGFRHQVRCHLAWNGLPIIDDPLYNPYTNNSNIIQFYAKGLSFENPSTGKQVIYSLKY